MDKMTEQLLVEVARDMQATRGTHLVSKVRETNDGMGLFESSQGQIQRIKGAQSLARLLKKAGTSAKDAKDRLRDKYDLSPNELKAVLVSIWGLSAKNEDILGEASIPPAEKKKELDGERALKRFYEGLQSELRDLMARPHKRDYRVVAGTPRSYAMGQVHINGKQAGPGVITIDMDLKALTQNPPQLWVQLSSKAPKWSMTIKEKMPDRDWGYLPFATLGRRAAKLIAGKFPVRAKTEAFEEASGYEAHNKEMADKLRAAKKKYAVKIGPAKVDAKGTKSLRAMKKLKARSRGDLDSALISAAYYAKSRNETMVVYPSNMYGHGVWRVTAEANKSEYTDRINNTGADRMASITPDLEMRWHELSRPT